MSCILPVTCVIVMCMGQLEPFFFAGAFGCDLCFDFLVTFFVLAMLIGMKMKLRSECVLNYGMDYVSASTVW